MSSCDPVVGPNITTIYYDSQGNCYASATSGDVLTGVNPDWSSPVVLTFEPQTSVTLFCNLNSPVRCGDGNPVYSCGIDGNGEKGVVTATFTTNDQRPGSVWGWDFSGTTAPAPIKIKVRVRRP